MNQALQKKRQEFFEFISKYEFINQYGRLDLEAFCVNLQISFVCDGIPTLAPAPGKVYELLIGILRDTAKNNEEIKLWVQHQKISDWSSTHSDANIYPYGFRTYIHIIGLLETFHTWIYNVGHTLIGIEEPKVAGKYFAWVKEEWTYVFTFINGFHNFLFDLLQKTDKSVINENGYSYFEALYLAKKLDIDYERASYRLCVRNQAQQDALIKIQQAVDASFFLEAITLQECFMSNCLFNYLNSKDSITKEISFFKLISETKQLVANQDSELLLLFDNLDNWRKQRNNAIHGYIKSRTDELENSSKNFHDSSKKTAFDGIALCQSINDWYKDESIRFLQTKWE